MLRGVKSRGGEAFVRRGVVLALVAGNSYTLCNIHCSWLL